MLDRATVTLSEGLVVLVAARVSFANEKLDGSLFSLLVRLKTGSYMRRVISTDGDVCGLFHPGTSEAEAIESHRQHVEQGCERARADGFAARARYVSPMSDDPDVVGPALRELGFVPVVPKRALWRRVLASVRGWFVRRRLALAAWALGGVS